jgi:hypothetical protein
MAKYPSLTVVLVTVGVASPIIYSLYSLRQLSRSLTGISVKTVSATSASARIFPQEVLDHPAEYVISQEHSYKTVPLDSIPVAHSEPSQLVVKYLRQSMTCFSKLPQASIMYFMISDLSIKATFGAKYLSDCEFDVGDVVCGVYQVKRKEDAEVQLDLTPPAGWTGPKVSGCIVSSIQLNKADVSVRNDVFLWRRVGEPPTMLETPFGRWFHSMTAAYVVGRGTENLLRSFQA